ncbi:hypothetical protein P5P86_16075 [Nocardioides sp. BP30]|uniref:DUF6758 family protein n=1 Tax=Nocardioides sp. BP30 TaxID=3036374 RepID=UPI002469C2B4|nr:DUF6758 family protein [Nocardioides sp. BP30]WGL51471.1 hypothetical protein P5P86_16075 [Nocardioides sp. BP30]
MPPLAPGCPRCPTPVARVGEGGRWACPDHGPVRPLWRPETPSYDGFVAHLDQAGGFPTYLPWPLSPGWAVTDFAVVGDERGATATLTCVSGPSELDGPVDLLVVAEEAGVGLGARCAGTPGDDPGIDADAGPPAARLRIGSQPVPLWPVSSWETSSAGPVGEWDRSVVVGEAAGRWLWLVLRPASAILLLHEEWLLRDVSGLGMALVEVPFGGPHGTW